MNENLDNVVNLYPEHKSAPVAQMGYKNRTVWHKLRKAFSSLPDLVFFSTRQVVTALFSLTLPLLLIVIGFALTISYLFFGLLLLMIIFSDHTYKALEMMILPVGLFLICKIVIYVLAWIKVKLGLA